MSEMNMKDIDEHNHNFKTITDDINEISDRIRTLSTSWQELSDWLNGNGTPYRASSQPDRPLTNEEQAQLDKWVDNEIDAKKERDHEEELKRMYHQGDQEEGELMQVEEDGDGDL